MMQMHPLGPDRALVLGTTGTLLIYVELNRPGLILPGSLGLLAVLLACATFVHQPPPLSALILLAAAALTFARALRRDTSALFFFAATLCLTDAFVRLPTSLPVALVCGLCLGLTTAYLVAVARRARTNKGHR